MGLRAIVLALSVAAFACNIRVSEDDNASNRAQCGNSRLDEGEVCDDGNTDDGDGCSADCASDETCGNGVVDTTVGESCDDGDALGGDGCSSDCKSTEECGNGVVDTATGETCDDGNLILGDGCSANCQSNEACGNFLIDPGTTPTEDCDDGPDGSAACNKNCTNTRCGDGIVNLLADEECEDQNSNNGDACDNNCKKVECGDGRVTGDEDCDDDNSDTSDDCISCVAARCGDGYVRDGVEQCDDNNNDNGDGCDGNCNWEPVVYVIDSQGSLSNQDGNCSSDNQSFYDNCAGGNYGFSWDDNAPFQPSSVQIELVRGIDCATYYSPLGFGAPGSGTTTKQTFINGNYEGDVTMVGPDDGNACNCDPGSRDIQTYSLPANGYQTGTTNTFELSAAVDEFGNPMCAGFSFDGNIGGFARITVFP